MSLTSNIWDRLGTLTPTRDAAVATSGGETYEWRPPANASHWDTPPQCEPLPKEVTDLAGIRFGQMRVVRYFAGSKKNGSRWLCRCDCGAYETRFSKSIKAPKTSEDKCAKCSHLRHLRHQAHALATGYWPSGQKANFDAGLKTAAGNVRLKDGPR